jgi:hypothetical protein
MSDRPFITSKLCPVLTKDLKGTLNATWHINSGEYDPVEATYRLMNCGEEALPLFIAPLQRPNKLLISCVGGFSLPCTLSAMVVPACLSDSYWKERPQKA